MASLLRSAILTTGMLVHDYANLAITPSSHAKPSPGGLGWSRTGLRPAAARQRAALSLTSPVRSAR